MKKLNRVEVIELLKNKGTKTFKELSIISGYHEKSLNRIWKGLKDDSYKEIHGNKGRSPHNKISEQEKKKLIVLYQNGKYSNKKNFYKDLRSKGYTYSYSFVAKLIITKKKKKPVKKVPEFLIIPRKMILENTIQYRNKRYFIKAEIPISHRECVDLFVKRETLEPLYIKYKNQYYSLVYQKEVFSKKGNSKY